MANTILPLRFFGRSIVLFSCLSVLTIQAGFSTPPGTATVSIVAFASSEEAALRGAGVVIWTRSGDAIVGAASDEALTKLAQSGISPLVKAPEAGQSMFLLHHDDGMTAPRSEGATIYTLSPAIDLYLYPAGVQVTHPFVKPKGQFMGIPRIPVGPVAPHAADLQPATLAPDVVNPLVTQIVNGTSQAN